MICESRPAFAHGDMVGRIKTQSADVAERPDMPAVESCPKRVTTVLDEKKIVTFGNFRDARGVERIAERVGNHYGARLRSDCILNEFGSDVVSRDVYVDEDRCHPAEYER